MIHCQWVPLKLDILGHLLQERKEKKERKNERKKERTKERTKERKNERKKKKETRKKEQNGYFRMTFATLTNAIENLGALSTIE